MAAPTSETPAGPPSQASTGEQARPPLARTAGAPARRPISGLNGSARDTRCLRFARTVAGKDARLASGCWPDSSGWAQGPTGFLRKVLSCLLHLASFPRLSWRKRASVRHTAGDSPAAGGSSGWAAAGLAHPYPRRSWLVSTRAGSDCFGRPNSSLAQKPLDGHSRSGCVTLKPAATQPGYGPGRTASTGARFAGFRAGISPRAGLISPINSGGAGCFTQLCSGIAP